MDHPNILLIVTDQQSVKALHHMHNPHLLTPALDTLAKQGTSFANAYCCNPVCVPSRIGMFTGHYPHEAGIYLNSHNTTRELKNMPWMGKLFAQAGYETYYYGKSHLLVRPWQKWIHGFRSFIITTGRDKDEQAAALCCQTLNQEHCKPFLMVVSIVNPHNVCELARKSVLPEADIGDFPPLEQCPPLPTNFSITPGEPDAIREAYHASDKRYPTKQWTEQDWRQYLWGYYRLVEHVDRIVGSILDALSHSRHAKNTIVIFTSDHGEGMAEHGWNQKQSFYEAVARVPFIIAHPGAPAKGNINETTLVNNGVDLVPTIADLAGISLAGRKDLFPGKSLKNGIMVPFTPPESPASGDNMPFVVSESEFGGFVEKNWTHGDRAYGRMIRTPKFKYVVYSRGQIRESLVDLTTDPAEMVNLATDSRYTVELENHRAILKEWCRQTHDDFPLDGLHGQKS